MLSGNPGGGNPPPAGGNPPAGNPGGGNPPPAGGGGNPPPVTFQWDASLPKETMDLLTAKAFDKNPNALATAYYHANKALSGAKDVIALPADDAPAEAWAKFNEQRGVPKDPAGYADFKFKDGVQTDAEFVAFGKKFFHALGVPASKAQAAIDMWQEFALGKVAAGADSARQANEAELKQLETSWGKEKWNTAVVAGQAAFKALGLPAEVVSKVEAGIGGAAVLQLMAALGAKIPKEGAVLTDGGGGGVVDPTQMTLAQLESAKANLLADAEFMKQYNEAGPKHDEAVKRMLHINEQIVARQKAARGG
mgnify:CR=1 FL=1